MGYKIIGSFLIVIAFLMNTFSVYATEMNFAVTAMIPDNQLDKKQTYFDLQMHPGQKQIIQVQVKNDTDKEVVVESHANTAVTNSNGITDYSVIEPKLDNTMQFPFSKIATVQKETKIPAKSTVTLDVKIEMPHEVFDGVILGGLYFKEKEDPKEPKKKKDVQIENKYAYAIGVLLRETDKEVRPDLKINDVIPT